MSQKQNVLGVGKKQHRTSDQWWMNAFDKSLKGLDTSNEGKVIQTISNGGLDMVAKGGGKYVGSGGLYACFVKGETLVGDQVPETPIAQTTITVKKSKNTKKDRATKEARRARKQARRAARAVGAPGIATPSVLNSNSNSVETKEERRERRHQKKMFKAAAFKSQVKVTSKT